MARTALVTGVGKRTGLGFAVAEALVARGDTVWVTARRPEAAAEMAAAIAGPGRAVPAALDVADEAQVAALAARVAAETGLDVLVNNAAGVAPWGETAAGADLAVARGVIETTLLGTWAACQAFLPLLRLSPAGRLVVVSSGAGSHGDPEFGLATRNGMGTSYAVAKAALNALVARLALEEEGPVRINAVCPGFTATFEGGAAMGARPVAEGAASILWAADLPEGGPTGGFFRDGRPLPW